MNSEVRATVNDDFEWEVLDCDSARIYKEECRYVKARGLHKC